MVVIGSARKRVLIVGCEQCFADSSWHLPKNRRSPRPRSPPVRLSSAIGLYRHRLGPSPPPPPSTRSRIRAVSLSDFAKRPVKLVRRRRRGTRRRARAFRPFSTAVTPVTRAHACFSRLSSVDARESPRSVYIAIPLPINIYYMYICY